jgi:hypothetical protein
VTHPRRGETTKIKGTQPSKKFRQSSMDINNVVIKRLIFEELINNTCINPLSSKLCNIVQQHLWKAKLPKKIGIIPA